MKEPILTDQAKDDLTDIWLAILVVRILDGRRDIERIIREE